MLLLISGTSYKGAFYMTLDISKDKKYMQLLLKPIKKSADYRPKFGTGSSKGVEIDEFKKLYGSDPFYHWLGLDNDLMYASHKASGGMTSIYRQVGKGGETLFREILKDSLGLNDDDANWSYTIKQSNGKEKTLYLDGRIITEKVKQDDAREKVESWIKDYSKILKNDDRITSILSGVVFEVRQGYKSKDSKRQNADLANASSAYTNTYLPCIAVLSTQMDVDIAERYKVGKWAILRGIINGTPYNSTYSFMKDVVGYDLEGFFERNKDQIRKEVEQVLVKLLTP